jgi:hypothetical protein
MGHGYKNQFKPFSSRVTGLSAPKIARFSLAFGETSWIWPALGPGKKRPREEAGLGMTFSLYANGFMGRLSGLPSFPEAQGDGSPRQARSRLSRDFLLFPLVLTLWEANWLFSPKPWPRAKDFSPSKVIFPRKGIKRAV